MFLNLSNIMLIKRYRDFFSECFVLTSLNIANFNTSNYEYMGFMFSGCHSLVSLYITNFDTSQVTDIFYMFNEC